MSKKTRIYLGITGTGGKVLGSVEAGVICEIVKCDGYDARYQYLEFVPLNTKMHSINVSEYEIENQGYTGQRFAIEILDFRVEDLTIEDFAKPGTADTCDMGEIPTNDYISKLPRSFCYVEETDGSYELAILMPIKQKYYDMIMNGEKGYIFMNPLPKALRR